MTEIRLLDGDTGSRPLGAMATGAYAIGAIGTGLFSTVPTVLLLYYCTETLGVPPALAALAVFAPKAWSILWDPIVGAWSDRMRTPFGRRRPFLLAGAMGVFAPFIALFSAPTLTPISAFIWVSLSYFLFTTAYSLFAIPYNALPSQLGRSAGHRSSMVSARMTVAIIGVLAGAAVAPMLVEQLGGGRKGYASMAWVLASVSSLAMLGPVVVLRGRDLGGASLASAAFMPQLTAAARDTRLRLLAASYILQIAASGAFSAMAPYLVTHVAGRPPGEIGVAMGLMLAVATAATPVWAGIGRRHGEARVNIAALALYAAALVALGAASLAQLPWPVLLCFYAAVGIPFAATQVLPFVLQSHVAHAAAQSSAAGSTEGAFAGAWTAVEKLGLALGPMLSGLALSTFGTEFNVGVPFFVMVAPPALLLLSIAPLAAIRFSRETS